MSMQHSPQIQPKSSEGKNTSNQQNVFLDVVDAFQNYIGNKLSMDWRGINMESWQLFSITHHKIKLFLENNSLRIYVYSSVLKVWILWMTSSLELG